jgi:hypothetical protein
MNKVMKNRKVIVVMVVGLVAILLAASGVVTGAPSDAGDPPVASKINYQGQLTDSAGNPLDGTYDMEFRFYDAVSGGSQVGTPISKSGVQVTNGLFSVKLDANRGGFNGEGRWLEVEVEGETLSPRQEILPVPYALSLKPGAVIDGEANHGGINVFNSGEDFSCGVYSEAWNTGDVQNYGGFFVAAGTEGRGVYGKAASTDDAINYGGFFYASGVEGRGVFGQSAGSSGIGVKGWASDDGDVENYGGHFCASGEGGVGVYGWAENTEGRSNYGGKFLAEGSCGVGVWGRADSGGTGGSNFGGYFVADGTGSFGVCAMAKKTGVLGKAEKEGGHFVGEDGKGVIGEGQSCGGYFLSSGDGGAGVYTLALGADSTGITAVGGPAGCYAADFIGNVIIRTYETGDTVVELGQGLDYAEGFDVSDKKDIDPGSVLIIDPDNPGKLTVSDKAYDSKVAGIVAGAKGMGSGVRLGGDQFDYNVALAGRVYCNVDATEAAVEPGDLLTTSAIPGYAMKVTDYELAQGAILGKAMEGLEKGQRGQILVLVTLQ